MMREFFEGIEVKLSWRDTREMRPITRDEMVDDYIAAIQNELLGAVYGASPGSAIGGLGAWLPTSSGVNS